MYPNNIKPTGVPYFFPTVHLLLLLVLLLLLLFFCCGCGCCCCCFFSAPPLYFIPPRPQDLHRGIPSVHNRRDPRSPSTEVVFRGLGFFQGRTARWAPANYKWSYKPYKWPYKWVTGVITLLIGVITPFITSRGPTLN